MGVRWVRMVSRLSLVDSALRSLISVLSLSRLLPPPPALFYPATALPNLPRSTSASPFPQSQPHPSFANPTSYLHNPQQHSYNAPTPTSFSPAPLSATKKRFASSSNLAAMAGPRASLKRGAGDDGRSGKRSRMDDSEEDGMELDQLAEREASRGTKRRMRREGEGESKRRRGEEEGEDEEKQEEDGMDEDDVPSSSHPSSARSRKHVRSSPTASEEAEEEGHEKRRRSDRKGGKRVIEDVSSESEDEGSDFEDDEEGEGRRRVRNADSEIDSASEAEDNEEELDSRSKSKRHDPKRARSTSIAERTGSEDESVMGDDDPSSLPPPRRQQQVPSSATPRKRISASSTKKSGASARLGSRFKEQAAPRKMSSLAQRTAGEEWTNLEGDRCRMDGEGMVRRLAEVREMRRRYKVRLLSCFSRCCSADDVAEQMPQDSVHPDAKLMHEVRPYHYPPSHSPPPFLAVLSHFHPFLSRATSKLTQTCPTGYRRTLAHRHRVRATAQAA